MAGGTAHSSLIQQLPCTHDRSSRTIDRRDRPKTITQGAAITTLFYNDANQLTGEGYPGGTLSGLAVTNLYDTTLRRTNALTKNGGTTLSTASFAYDAASWLTNVTDGTYSAGYAYIANSAFVDSITFRQSGTAKLTTTNQ